MKLQGTTPIDEINFREIKSPAITNKLVTLFMSIAENLKKHHQNQKVKSGLREMDDKMLRDIGLNRNEVSPAEKPLFYWY